MNKKALTKITYKVLRHWEDNVMAKINKEMIDCGTRSCAYCQNFDCDECPCVIANGRQGCIPVINPSSVDKVRFTFDFLLNVAYSQGIESEYMEEL